MSERLNQPRKKSLSENASIVRGIIDVVGFTAVTNAELVRASLVEPSASPLIQPGVEPTLSPDSPMFTILQNSGDFYDGFSLTFGGYTALSIADYLLSKISRRNIPVKLKLTASMFLSIGIVGIVEGGVWYGTSTADISDIPAGIAGAFVYGALNILSRKFVESRMNKQRIVGNDKNQNDLISGVARNRRRRSRKKNRR